jgi:hypothetical protein
MEASPMIRTPLLSLLLLAAAPAAQGTFRPDDPCFHVFPSFVHWHGFRTVGPYEWVPWGGQIALLAYSIDRRSLLWFTGVMEGEPACAQGPDLEALAYWWHDPYWQAGELMALWAVDQWGWWPANLGTSWIGQRGQIITNPARRMICHGDMHLYRHSIMVANARSGGPHGYYTTWILPRYSAAVFVPADGRGWWP